MAKGLDFVGGTSSTYHYSSAVDHQPVDPATVAERSEHKKKKRKHKHREDHDDAQADSSIISKGAKADPLSEGLHRKKKVKKSRVDEATSVGTLASFSIPNVSASVEGVSHKKKKKHKGRYSEQFEFAELRSSALSPPVPASAVPKTNPSYPAISESQEDAGQQNRKRKRKHKHHRDGEEAEDVESGSIPSREREVAFAPPRSVIDNQVVEPTGEPAELLTQKKKRKHKHHDQFEGDGSVDPIQPESTVSAVRVLPPIAALADDPRVEVHQKKRKKKRHAEADIPALGAVDPSVLHPNNAISASYFAPHPTYTATRGNTASSISPASVLPLPTANSPPASYSESHPVSAPRIQDEVEPDISQLALSSGDDLLRAINSMPRARQLVNSGSARDGAAPSSSAPGLTPQQVESDLLQSALAPGGAINSMPRAEAPRKARASAAPSGILDAGNTRGSTEPARRANFEIEDSLERMRYEKWLPTKELIEKGKRHLS
jgi:hypothetical protein